MPSHSPTSSPRLVAIDLDGTLLRDDKTISPEAGTALRRLSDVGTVVVIASARPPRSVEQFHKALGLATPSVCYNGALIWQHGLPAGVLEHHPLAGTMVRLLTAAARELHADCLLNIEATDRWITDRVDARFQTQTARLFPPDVIAPLHEWHEASATKVMVQGDPRPLEHVARQLTQRFAADISLVSTEPDCLQIVRAGVNKAAGVLSVARRLGISPADVLAIGDNDNDAEMLAAFGWSAAMGTGTEKARKSAKVVVGSHNESGVLEALAYAGLLI